MECHDCGIPYMAGLEFTVKGNVLRCKSCYEKVVKLRQNAFSGKFSKQKEQ